MYNRYVPTADGVYERKIVPSPPKADKPPPQPQSPPQIPVQSSPTPQYRPTFRLPQLQLDSGDLLVLLILLLMLTEGEDNDPLSLLITLGAFLLLQ